MPLSLDMEHRFEYPNLRFLRSVGQSNFIPQSPSLLLVTVNKELVAIAATTKFKIIGSNVGISFETGARAVQLHQNILSILLCVAWRTSLLRLSTLLQAFHLYNAKP
jgi:hypothetical protein